MAKPRRRVEPFKVFLDENVPHSVGEAFAELGHNVVYHQDALEPGASDHLVARAALLNAAVLVACDNDEADRKALRAHRA